MSKVERLFVAGNLSLCGNTPFDILPECSLAWPKPVCSSPCFSLPSAEGCGTRSYCGQYYIVESGFAKAKKAVAVAPLFSLPAWLDVEAWEAYDEMRRKQKKPMTERARELVIAKLAKFEAQGLNTTEVLNQSVVNGWTEVYAPKQPTGGNNGKLRGTEGNDAALQEFLEGQQTTRRRRFRCC
jgi:hypothetical protein